MNNAFLIGVLQGYQKGMISRMEYQTACEKQQRYRPLRSTCISCGAPLTQLPCEYCGRLEGQITK